jgi:shikimate dehydrogenase
MEVNKLLFGLFGKHLSHSFSGTYFNNKFITQNIDAEYKLFEIEKIEKIIPTINKFKNLKGFNITIPYKTEIIPFLHNIDESVKNIGACNTVKIIDNELFGFNTDLIGFEILLNKSLIDTPEKAIILGNGGAAKAVKWILKQNKIDFLIVERTPKENSINFDDLNEEHFIQSKLIINTTPLGMFPFVNQFPIIPYQFINQQHKVIDLIYNPTETEFMKKCKNQGATAINGLDMLIGQAEAAWKIWDV